AANPRWLIYLPPTMSPSETSREVNLLEHPAEAFSYYRHQGIRRVVCEEKHIGSRAVLIVCRNEDTARERFGVVADRAGICHTRTGRRFCDDKVLETEFIERIRMAFERADLWNECSTDWFCLDCELMPWSAKAQELLRQQYGAVGAAARTSLTYAVAALERAAMRTDDFGPTLDRYRTRAEAAEKYIEAYQRYCWPVNSLEDLKLAPFHLLASEGKVHVDKDHVWHMTTLARLCEVDPALLLATPYLVVDVTDPDSEAAGIQWWRGLTGRGGEGMVVKPFNFVAKGP